MKSILHLFSFLFLVCFSINAQETKLLKANKQFANLEYINAIETYQKVAEKGYKSVELFQKLGDSYYFNGKLKEANVWYTELFGFSSAVEAEYFYRYSQTLKATEQFEKANEYLDKFHQMSANDIRGQLFEKQKNYKDIIDKNSGRYELKTIGINSPVSDYGAAFFGDKILFSSSRDTIGFLKSKNKWTNQAFVNLYVTKLLEGETFSKPEQFSKSINTRFDEATPVFTKDLKTVYFTRTNYTNGKLGKDKNRLILLKLYRATLVGDKWENITELPFNSNEYSVAHPALSPDDKTLYFASNMPGTTGQSDIFKVAITGDNTYGTPQNISGGINTEGKETFPFVTQNNELYFASDGHQGLGGLDIYVTKLADDGTPGDIYNVGAPVNGPLDDFAFIMNAETKKGYFSSNREGGIGDDDIYSFFEKTPLNLDCVQGLKGVITDAETQQILANAKVTLFDAEFHQLLETTSDANGNYTFDVDCHKKYYVRAEKEFYSTHESSVIIPNTSGQSELNLALEKSIKEIKVGTDLAKIFGIKIIYFDLDKSNIREEAAVDLAKIVDVMKQFPTMKVDVRSHTDSRQTHKYNESLSDRRAKSTIAWMIANGIEATRLTGKGYGETQLINKCADGVECTEDEHQQNRRSEFIVTEM